MRRSWVPPEEFKHLSDGKWGDPDLEEIVKSKLDASFLDMYFLLS